MAWLFVIILAYFFFSLASLGDKLVLKQSQNPKIYVFYIGCLGLFVLVFIPFSGLTIFNIESFFWIIASSLTLLFGLYALFSAVERFEVSRVVPIFGSIQPIFILFLSIIFLKTGILDFKSLLAFSFLLLGTIFISFERGTIFNKDLLKLSLLASFFIALNFVFMKVVFINLGFFQGIIWVGIFNFLFVLSFLTGKSFRNKIFAKKSAFDKKTIKLVLLTQMAGGFGGILQNFAVYLAPAANLAIMNALRGVQYAFLFAMTLLFSVFLPKILKEEISLKIIFQKVFSIILIIVGLYILVF